MIRLNQTATQLLSLITAQNGAVAVVSYSDKTSTAYTGDTQVTAITSATTTTICSTPAASTIRDIDHISIKNTYAGSQAVIVQISSSATLYPLVTFTLANGDSIEYTHGSGWQVLDSTGQLKTSVTVSDGDKGDITVSAAGGTWTIDSDVITTAARTVLDDATVSAMVDTLGGAASTGTGGLARSTSPVLTTPQINDTSSDHQYIFAASELTADRTVTLPLLTGNDEFVFKDHTQTLTNKTLTGALSSATLADGINTLALADAQFVNSQINLHTDQKQNAMGIDLTVSSTVGALTAADNANLDVGTYNFTLAWTGSLPDWTPSANVILLHKHDGTTGYIITLLTTGILRLTMNATTYDSTVATGLPDGATAHVSAIVTRESASAAGSIVFKVGEYTLGASVAITAGAPATLDNASSLNVGGTSTTRFASRNHAARIFNRALTDAEWSRFVKTGVDYSDIGASQTALNVSNCANANYETFTGASPTGFAASTSASAGAKSCGTADEIIIVAGKEYIGEFDFVLNSGALPSISLRSSYGGAVASTTTTQQAVAGHNTIRIVGSLDTTGIFHFNTGVSVAANFEVSNLKVVRAGAIANYEPSGIQPNQWHDSANDNHLTFPSSGASLSQWKETGQNNWTVAITGDTTLTSIVPAGYRLDSILFKNSTAGAVSVRLGTTAGGTDIFGLTALNTSATLGGYTPVATSQGFSPTAAQTLYLSSTDWTGGGTAPSLTFTMYFRRIS